MNESFRLVFELPEAAGVKGQEETAQVVQMRCERIEGLE